MFFESRIEGGLGAESHLISDGENREMPVRRIEQPLFCFVNSVIVDKVIKVLFESVIDNLREMVGRDGKVLGQFI